VIRINPERSFLFIIGHTFTKVFGISIVGVILGFKEIKNQDNNVIKKELD